MASEPTVKAVLIITGTSIRAEELDRPLAYYLKQKVEAALVEGDHGAPPPRVVVMSDLRWLHDEPLQVLPTICLGGPGVNALSRRWLEQVPLSMAVDDRYYIQMDPDLDDPHVCIWGMDNANTQIAVSLFVDRFLPFFLDQVLTADLDPTDIDLDAEDND
jgi:hypothetical protein